MHPPLKANDTVGLISLSDGIKKENSKLVNNIRAVFESMGLRTVLSGSLYKTDDGFSPGSAEKRAVELNAFYHNPEIKAVFDISGGNLAHQVLPFLHYEGIQAHPKPFFGYSDLTPVLSVLAFKSKIPAVYFNSHTLYGSAQEEIKRLLKEYLFQPPSLPVVFPYRTLNGGKAVIKGPVSGGNIRCFLKLAGTPYMPNIKGTLLFLEGYSGTPQLYASMIAQLEQMEVFSKVKALILGNFSEMDKEKYRPDIEELITPVIRKYKLPAVRTNRLGHEDGDLFIPIGEPVTISLDPSQS